MENLRLKTPILDALKDYIAGKTIDKKFLMIWPPPIARTLGFDLVEVDYSKAVIQIQTSVETHANPMGTIHGGVLGNIADAAIGVAHATTLLLNESFTSIDFRINFFRPIWNSILRAIAQPVQLGKTISYYECKIIDDNNRLIAMVTSSVMTLRGENAKGR